jgi:hypothetical protein
VQLTGVGAVFVPVQLPRKPNPAVPPAPSEPFQPTFAAVTAAPLDVTVAFHAWVIVCPLGNAQVTRQPEMALLPVLVTVTSPWKPPGQKLVIV